MKKISILALAIITISANVFTSCESVKNTNKTQRGAAIGTVGGAVLRGHKLRISQRQPESRGQSVSGWHPSRNGRWHSVRTVAPPLSTGPVRRDPAGRVLICDIG